MDVGTLFPVIWTLILQIVLVKTKEMPLQEIRRIEHVTHQVATLGEHLSHLPYSFRRFWTQLSQSVICKGFELGVGWFKVPRNDIAVRNTVDERLGSLFATKNQRDEVATTDDEASAIPFKIFLLVEGKDLQQPFEARGARYRHAKFYSHGKRIWVGEAEENPPRRMLRLRGIDPPSFNETTPQTFLFGG
jgi:hypothetical protein